MPQPDNTGAILAKALELLTKAQKHLPPGALQESVEHFLAHTEQDAAKYMDQLKVSHLYGYAEQLREVALTPEGRQQQSMLLQFADLTDQIAAAGARK